jgi:hypothetical protein
MIRRSATSAAIAALTALALVMNPANAGAGQAPSNLSVLARVQRAYEARGRINPCQFTSQQLATALKSIDTYGAQYFADFSNAVQGALDARASGACEPQSSSPAAATNSAPTKPLRLGSVTAPTGAGLPAPVLLMALLAALAALVGTIVALSWWRGWVPAWAAPWQHLRREAGYRLEGTWLDFSDWLRSGSR